MPEIKDEQNTGVIKAEYVIKKPNPLLLMREDMTTKQFRFFCAYLSKVNPLDTKTYTVRFTLKSFYEIVGIVDDRHITNLENTLNGLANMLVDFSKYVNKSSTKDKLLMKKRHLFEGYDLYKNSNGEYYVDVIPSYTLVKLLKGKYGYITPKSGYELPLTTKKWMRMYDFFYQVKDKRVVTININNFKAYLGMDTNDYPDTKVFIRDILKKGIKEINEQTDLMIEYESIKKGKKIIQFKFIIKNNPDPKPLAKLSFYEEQNSFDFDAETPLDEYRSANPDVDFDIDYDYDFETDIQDD